MTGEFPFSPFSNYSIMRFNSFNNKQKLFKADHCKMEGKTCNWASMQKLKARKMQHVIKRQLP